MNISHLLRRSAQVFPSRPALLAGERVLHDYRRLATRVAALAGHLRTRCGVAPGDRVAIFSANCPQYLEALHAIHWAGAVSVPVNYKLHARELAYVLEHSGARAPPRTASRPSSTAAAPCTWRTCAARWTPWARSSCRSTARARAP
jgi:long-chain acyl-CoA synthetase